MENLIVILIVVAAAVFVGIKLARIASGKEEGCAGCPGKNCNSCLDDRTSRGGRGEGQPDG